MNLIKATKMQGCGNDFVIIDYDEFLKTKLEPAQLALKICDRHFGIGADGLIIVYPNNQETDISWIFYNSDGTSAQMCGNGMRCFAKYVYDKNFVNKKQFSVKTLSGIISPEILDENSVKVNMGTPILEPKKIPFCGEKTITVYGKTFEINPVSMGNPHCVIFTDKNPKEMATKYGSEIEKHEFFPEKTNVEFVKIISKNEIQMCVYERGCGITLACGTGACASVVAGVLNNLTETNVKVNLLGGPVTVEWEGLNKNIYLTGPAQYSFYADYML